MPEWLGLEGQRVVVAGGAGTIGAALVAAFLDERASVGVIDLDIANVHPGVTAAVRADLSDPDVARSSLNAARERLDGLDVLVHCVGINDRKPIESYTATEWDRIIDADAGDRTRVRDPRGHRECRGTPVTWRRSSPADTWPSIRRSVRR
jgi:gluconate 5-dehydrogenase